MERFLGTLFVPKVIALGGFSANQFAYRAEHGARDAILYFVMVWLSAFAHQSKIGLYCSDASEAFDRVSAERLLQRLKLLRLHPRFQALLASWLRERTAAVVVDGATSRLVSMKDMVYQGTVWGPALWNVYFAGANGVIEAEGF